MVQTQQRRGFLKQNPLTARLKKDGGRWGVGQGCNCHAILDAIASLLEVQRPDLAMVLIEEERKVNMRWKGSDSVQLH